MIVAEQDYDFIWLNQDEYRTQIQHAGVYHSIDIVQVRHFVTHLKDTYEENTEDSEGRGMDTVE